jgi:ArsR family metal-binding transcriptional regulator
MEKLITDYQVRLVEPGCAPGSARYGVQIDVPNDISPVFPYFNAILDNASYDHENRILIWREHRQAYALRPHEIRIAPSEETLDSRLIASEIIERINRVWQERYSITPRFTEKGLPAVIDIYKLLPKTNCRKCGYPTCLAFSAALRSGEARLEQCLPLLAEQKERLLALVSSQ